ncbi:hypothetical protein ACFPZ0_15125 [Streptomonospora nanhaiensis]|uniref:Uncharacterized protein n=1 Tax=Streptomonospora nanhaiensis TaxID=1323731 RepID=A0A853BHV4_9ACTN|nr:hypothetical protein [Streptomonospora nanhaiensis]MBX9390422.1 hypothetical protein [Streptomonospora nanhaiensis]NYI94201.1 hypothetical protein [Streptomonospora nanhaiensis]
MPVSAPARLLALAAALALSHTAAAPAHAAAQPDYPGHTDSRYLELDGSEADLRTARDAGCADARQNRDGLRILFLGTQEDGDLLRPPGTTASTGAARTSTDRVPQVAAAYADSFAQCRTGDTTALLALGVNNKDDGGVSGAAAGTAWARVVEAAAQRADNKAVTVTGAVDAEPSWSTPSWARSWVGSYTRATQRTLYAANSADGCPTSATGTTACNNGWDLADVHYTAGGAAPTVLAIPQIYRTDGIQARQWAAVSHWGHVHADGPLRFAGALAQHTACSQRGGCERTDNTPKAAWTQLRDALNANADTRVKELPYASDMSWA